MVQRNKLGVARESAAEREMRDREVLRANRELAAYFKGQRTESEARAALKTIKAFVRSRQRQDPKSLAPLPHAAVAKTPKEVTNRKAANDRGERPRRKVRRESDGSSSKKVTTAIGEQGSAELSQLPESDQRIPE